ncbi:MAG: N-acetylmuramoyl-L-alanine amidase [Candidatus Omnitrophota bacterium]|nr:N-acetylmuramoyl-L-alanine amidase [Candidatus Omnitrophota bacterium]
MEYKYKIRFTILLTILSVFWLTSCTVTHVARPPAEAIIYETPVVPDHFRGGLYHSVAPGETLWRIARMYDVDVETIKNANSIRDVSDIEIGTRLLIPEAVSRRHVITLYPSRKWKYIIIHHSATDYGSSEKFNRAHLSRGWKGVGYHFVIDNGTCGKGDGQIETTPRWIKQQNGAHCKAGGMNLKGIGICLVGNFSTGEISSRQMNSLVILVKKLKKYYRIPKNRIMGHGQVPGANTECPGKNFPWKKFWSKVR